MNNKYTFVKNDTITLADGRTVYRIVATKKFGNVSVGMLGGYVESKLNLAEAGDCWVSFSAIAAGNSRITGNAILRDNAYADDYAKVSDDAIIEGNAQLLGDCFVYERGRVGANTILSGACTICGNAIVRCQPRRSVSGKTILPNVSGVAVVRENAVLEGKVCLLDRCLIEGNATVRHHSRITDDAYVGGYAIVEGVVSLSDNVKIIGRARIGGRSKIRGNAVVRGDAIVRGKSLILCNAYIYGKSVIENGTISGDETCSCEIIRQRQLMPLTGICERKREIPASSLQQVAVSRL